MLAADRWRIMCKHCRMLAKTNSPCPQPELKKVLALIKVDYDSSEPADAATPDESTPSMLETQAEVTDDSAATARPCQIPYLTNGLIDWDLLDDLDDEEAEKFEVEVIGRFGQSLVDEIEIDR